MKGKPLKAKLTEETLLEQFRTISSTKGAHNEHSLVARPKVTKQSTQVGDQEE